LFLRNPSEIARLKDQFSHLKQSTNIIVCAENMNDGIGDFRNAADAFRDIKKIAPNHHVKLIVIAELEQLEKIIALAKFVSPESASNIAIIYLNSPEKNQTDVDIAKSDILFFIASKIPLKDYKDKFQNALLNNDSICNFLKNTYFVLNVSVCLNISNIDPLLRMLPNNCKINSIVEYGMGSRPALRYPCKLFSGENIAHEVSMGIRLNTPPTGEVGIKLNHGIYMHSLGSDKKDKVTLLESLSQNLLGKIMGLPDNTSINEKMRKEYFSNKLLAVGYTKGEVSCVYFSYVLLGLAQNKKVTHIDLIMRKDTPEHYQTLYDLSNFTIIVINENSNDIEKYGNKVSSITGTQEKN